MMPASLDLASLRTAYASGRFTPVQLIEALLPRLQACAPEIFIARVPDELLRARARELAAQDPASLPLYGVPFAIKDNIDLAGLPTTAACEAFAYAPRDNAHVVQALLDAGAIAIGKTNLDQFATGLVGTRSPWGAVRNSFDPAYISGGSSSGSAAAVAQGLASFALGTDTAGSGRIPAAFNNLIGLKPSCGSLSTRGVVPACQSLDCVSIFALTAEDAAWVLRHAGGVDPLDPWSRQPGTPAAIGWGERGPLRFGHAQAGQLDFLGNADYAALHKRACHQLQSLGGAPVAVDIAPLLEAARLLYDGPWISERYLAVEALLRSAPEALLPVTRQIIEAGALPTATAAFRAQYRLAALRRQADALWQHIDVLLLPTAAIHWRIDEVQADPIGTNSALGRYTNFVNLLDMAAVAVPAGFTPQGLPFGVTLIGPSGSDADLVSLAGRLQRVVPAATLGATGQPLPPAPACVADGRCIDVAVCGAHLSGLPLNGQLTSRGARLRRSTTTAPSYRLYALPGGPPQRPGLVRVAEGGVAIEVEVWSVPAQHLGSFIDAIPAPLGIGRVRLADGSQVAGFVCEALGVVDAQDISSLGSWRRFVAG